MSRSIGDTLREGRLHQHLSLAECAKRTHISLRYLEALEEERWNDMPSESHRVGFLRLYARFLGVYSEEMIHLYRQAQLQAAPVIKPREIQKPARFQPGTRVTAQRLGLGVIFALVSIWGIYHAVRRYYPDRPMDLSWLRIRPRTLRLVAPRRELQVQRIRAKAEADSWVRVTDNHQMVFEGILPAGAVKEWSGPGPFRIKIGNITAVSIVWNDQPVDIKAAARGHVAELKLPPTAE